MDDAATLHELDAAGAEAALDELADVLVDAVANGASVNFTAAFTRDDAHAFWRGQLDGIRDGGRRLIVARLGGRIVGTVVVSFAPQPNQPHRADIGKMLVHSSARRRGLGRRLLQAGEDAALADGRWLVVLDTEAGSAGDALYRSAGWTVVGTIPDYSETPAGPLSAATIFYKRLGA